MAGLNQLAGWRRAPCDGGMVAYSPDRATRIRIRPRVAVASSPRQLVARLIAEMYGPTARAVHAPTVRQVTCEGELAALASAELVASGRPAGCSVAIAGDEPCLCIDVVGADHRRHASELLDSVALGLGVSRQRWFVYAPPAGWLGLRRAGSTVWLHPAYPKVPARITVFDARAIAATPSERLDRFLFARMSEGFTALEPLRIEDTTSTAGLSGRLRIATGTSDGERRLLRIASVHSDDRFSYIAHLDGPDDPALEQQFRAVVASFEPLPCPTSVQEGPPEGART